VNGYLFGENLFLIHQYFPQTKPREWVSFWRESLPNTSIDCLQFCPKEFGPILACAGSSGIVTLFCKDDSMGLVSASNNNNNSGLPGQNNQNNGSNNAFFRRQSQQLKAHSGGVTALSWAPPSAPAALASGPAVGSYLTPAQGPKRFVSSGKDGNARLWRYHSEDRRWVEECVLNMEIIPCESGNQGGAAAEMTPEDGGPQTAAQARAVEQAKLNASNQTHKDWVNTASWRPNIGIPSSCIATGGYEGNIHIWTQSMEGQPWELSGKIDFNGLPVWNCRWSTSGLLLAVSYGEGAEARIEWFRESLDGEWIKVSPEGEKFFED